MTPALKSRMADRDFFAFCASLESVELKALSELSHVAQLGAGEIVYSVGDPGEALYIINRGVTELIPDASMRGTPSTYLSRGDIFGHLEALIELPRTHLVRTREPVSLQCIRNKEFTEIGRRVPSFFRYLCEQLASRLTQTRELALSKSHCLELSGNLTNFDLVTIYQTIASSMQTGELFILDENAQPDSAFFFEKGQLRSGQFQHLTGEEAFWQLFLSESLTGTFSFSSRDQPFSNCVQATEIPRNKRNMLILALQFRDDFRALKIALPNPSMKLCRRKLNFSWPQQANPELQPTAERIWQLAYTTPLSLSSLYHKCSVCELKIYQVVDELVRAELIRLVAPDDMHAAQHLVIESARK
jgi:CRP-like cAMP-binding protein